MSPVVSRTIIIATAIVALAAVVSTAILHRDSGFSVVVDDGKVAFDVQSNKVSLAEILNDAFDSATEGSSEKDIVTAVLESRGYYHISDVRLIDALRRLDGDDHQRVASALRGLLYDLTGPFSRPHTFLGANDDRLLAALDDLDQSEKVSPLVSSLWRMSINLEGIFRPRLIGTDLERAERIKNGYASACAGSILAGKWITIIAGSRAHSVHVNGDWPCRARTPQQLLAGNSAKLRLAPQEFELLVEPGTPETDSPKLETFVVVAPKNFATSNVGG